MKPTANHHHHRHRRLPINDTLVSAGMLEHAVDAILRRITLDRKHEVPYLAGYSRDGKTIYIDRDLPQWFRTDGRRFKLDRFLVLHEAVEKTLLDELGLRYQHAHQIALRAEQAAVRAHGIAWEDYDRFMQEYVKEAGDEKVEDIPVDLDVKPYRDEHDAKLLHEMQACIQAERRAARRKRAKKAAKR